MCFSTLPSNGAEIWIKRGSNGYTETGMHGTREEIRAKVDEFNSMRGITRAQEEAMVGGSMFGWDAPAAKPWTYNQDGTPRLPNQPKKNNPER